MNGGTTLTIVTRSLSAPELREIAARSELVALTGDALDSCHPERAASPRAKDLAGRSDKKAALARIDDDFMTSWVGRTVTGLVVATGSLCCQRAAVALSADFLALTDGATISSRRCSDENHRTGSLVAALHRRVGSRIVRQLTGTAELTAQQALEAGWADALVPAGADSVKWLRSWLGGRSLAALHSAATLTRRSHSYVGERIEFARLFSTGEPQSGLAAFLRKEPLDFASRNIVEIV
jgi:hypothetical protein